MKQDEDIKDFPYPLNQEIEENVPVKKHRIDPKTNRVSTTYELEKVKTTYFHAPKNKFRCKPEDHEFKSYDPKKWLFTCTKCPLVKKVYPTHKLVGGKLVRRSKAV
jgi:hypothetical protein